MGGHGGMSCAYNKASETESGTIEIALPNGVRICVGGLVDEKALIEGPHAHLGIALQQALLRGIGCFALVALPIRQRTLLVSAVARASDRNHWRPLHHRGHGNGRKRTGRTG
jgi:hypothetical protein